MKLNLFLIDRKIDTSKKLSNNESKNDLNKILIFQNLKSSFVLVQTI